VEGDFKRGKEKHKKPESKKKAPNGVKEPRKDRGIYMSRKS